MSQAIPWRQSLGVKLGGIALALLVVSLLLIVGNLTMLSSLQGDSARIDLFGKGRMYAYEMLALAYRFFDESGAGRLQGQKRLDQLIEAMDQRHRVLLQGDQGRGIPAATGAVADGIRQREEIWRTQIKPALKEITAKPTRQEAQGELQKLGPTVDAYTDQINKGSELIQQDFREKVRRFQLLQYGFAVAVLIALGLVQWISRDIAGRARALVRTAEGAAAGDLSPSATVGGSDELAALGAAFNTMTGNLRAILETEKNGRAQIEKHLEAEKRNRARIERLLEKIGEAVAQLSSATAQILASTTQQAAGAQEQAAAVSQTVTTVDQVTQTSDQAAQRAKGVGEAFQRTLEIGKAGRKAVEDSIAAKHRVKEQVEATAENILALAEQAQAIGEIIATVADIAEQSNLLALNAAIEASRAGEHGKGFSVVAGEVKALADQSKKATAQVRQILGEIQKATNTAVLSTEDVTTGVAAAIQLGGQVRETITTLAGALEATAQAAAQIVASAGQQATGMAQIHQAMKNIDQVAKQNLVAMRQAEQAAQNLNALGTQLTELTTE
jgi:methyl-accepting chemotaxis protein